MESNVRVRFAPSPTGALHIGGVRTALYNYLFARKHQGQFILRIEDTDQARFVPGAEQYILDALQWLGIAADEGPYRQSERTDIYQPYADQLVAAGRAYYAFDTPEELTAMRERLQAARVPAPQYNAVSRDWMRNSLTLPQDEVKALLDANVPHVIRIKVPHQQDIRFQDHVRGWVKVQAAALDDKVLMKSDGTPTYHFANVVDDHLMQISHVIRGEEWIPSTPIHVLLYQYLGWEDAMPQFVHLPLLLKPEGTGKLSKRDADQHDFPIFPMNWQDPTTGTLSQGFRERGYLPAALLNFLALLGWSPGGPQELFSKEELIQAFSLARIGKAGVKFDIYKAQWFNQHYLRALPDDELVQYLLQDLAAHNLSCPPKKALQICQLLKERAVFPQDFWEQGRYFFEPPVAYDQALLRKKWTEQARVALQELVAQFARLACFSATTARTVMHDVMVANGLKLNQLMPAVRLALTGQGAGPDLMMSMEVMGQAECIARIRAALEHNPMR